MAHIEKAKNQAGQTIFPVTVADAVLMGDGKTLKGELSELGSEAYKSCIVGDGEEYVKNNIYGLQPNHSYKVTLKETDWDKPSVQGAPLGFGIHRVINGEEVPIYIAKLEDDAKKDIVFTLPASFDYISIGGRATKGTKIRYNLEDITDLSNLSNELKEDSDKLHIMESEMVRSRLVGDGDNVVVHEIKGLIGGNIYRLSFKQTSWDITGVTVSSSGMFYLASVFNDTDTYIANALISTGKVNASYEFTVPKNCDFIKLQIRATKGVSVWYTIEDITDVKKLHRIATENNNVSSVRPMNIDTVNKVLDFGTDPVLCIGSTSYALKNIHSDAQKYRSIPYYASTSSSNVIVFNLDTKELYPKQWDYLRDDSEVLIGSIASVYGTREFLSASFPFAFTVDGKKAHEDDLKNIEKEAIKPLREELGYLKAQMENNKVVINATNSSHSSTQDLLKVSIRSGESFSISYGAGTALFGDSAIYHLTMNYSDNTSEQKFNLEFNKKYKIVAKSNIASFGIYYEQGSVVSNGTIEGKVQIDSPILLELTNEIQYDRYVKGINHRGWHEAPENTLIAYKESRKNGFHYVECDVSFTKDNVPVLLHDDTIDRTSNGTGAIADLTYDELLTFDFGGWKGDQYRETKIPTFESFIILCRNLMLHPYIEIKAYNISRANVENVVRIVNSCGMKGRVTYVSFSMDALEYVKNTDISARLGLISNTLTEADINNALSLRTDKNEIFINTFGVKENTQNVNLCIDADIPLEIWTIGTEAGILNANPYISGITSDNLIAGKVLYFENSL